MTRDLPRNDPDNGGPVVPADQCDEDYYSDASVQERKDRQSAKYGHLRPQLPSAPRRTSASPRPTVGPRNGRLGRTGDHRRC